MKNLEDKHINNRAVYLYVRNSKSEQEEATQREALQRWAEDLNIQNPILIIETKKGETDSIKRIQAHNIQDGSFLAFTEISRLSRNGLMDTFAFLKWCAERDIIVYSVYGKMLLGNELETEMMIAAWALGAKAANGFRRERGKSVHASKVANGEHFGRPEGSYSIDAKLKEHIPQIQTLVGAGTPTTALARLFNVDRSTMAKYLDRNEIRKIKSRK